MENKWERMTAQINKTTEFALVGEKVVFSWKKARNSVVQWKKIKSESNTLEKCKKKGDTMTTVLSALGHRACSHIHHHWMSFLFLTSSSSEQLHKHYNSSVRSHDNQVVVVAVDIVDVRWSLFVCYTLYNRLRKSRAVWWARVADMGEESLCYCICWCNQALLNWYLSLSDVT